MNEVFLKVVNMSIAASWIVLAMLVLRLLLKKAPGWISVLLWGIVAVRLICPFSFESALSLMPTTETIPLNIEMDYSPAIDSGVNVINNVINPVLSASLTPHPGDSCNPLQIWIPFASVLWIVGITWMLLYSIVSCLRLHRRTAAAVRCRDNIFRTEQISSPFVFGIIRPRIYLPFSLQEPEMSHVIAHESSHIRRGDHWWKSLGFLLLTIHWFNPLMWLAYMLLCRDIEFACDEKVIRGLDSKQRADYCQALVSCSVSPRTMTACPLAYGEVGVKQRVKSVMNYQKPAVWIILMSVAACIVISVCFLTNPVQDSFGLRITVPAGNQNEIAYTHEEICPLGNYITVTAGEGLGDTEVLLKPAGSETETSFDEPAYLTPGMPVKMEAEKGHWFQIGVKLQNPADEEQTVYINVENVEVRISDEQ